MQNELIMQDEPDVDVLQPGMMLLRGQYMIESYLVRGGFGVTYLARDSLERQVVIKECFPAAISCRVGDEVRPLTDDQSKQYSSILRHFVREARRLARLDHSNIVGVHQVFEENNTAYMALDHVEGDDLLTVSEEDAGRLTPALIRRSLETALHAIHYIHGEGILHRDISPDNFLIGQNDDLTLIDFGAAREQAGRESRALSALLAVKDGYSPHEFYMADVPQFACSDLYSLGATFFHLITGDAPPNSQDRLAALAANSPDPYQPLTDRISGYDRAFLALIDKSLSVLPKDRMQSAEEWLAALRGDPIEAPAAEDVAVFLGSDLRRKISRLVEDTNRTLTQGKPGDARRRVGKAAAKAKKPVEPVCRKPVDIFGNPIEDIEAWLRDQETLQQKRHAAGRLILEPEVQVGPSKKTAGKEQEAGKSKEPQQRGLFSRSMTALRFSRSHVV